VVGIAGALARRGRSVLALDLDPQGTLSHWLADRAGTASALLAGDLGDVHVQPVDVDGGRIDLVPADRSLARFDDDRAARLSKQLERLWEAASGYDVALIDPPPSVGALVLAALMASDGALSPVEAGPGATDGLKDTLQLVSQTGAAPVRGIFACRVDVRTSLDMQVPDGLRDSFGAVKDGGRAFQTYVRQAVAMREAQAARELPAGYDSGMTAVQDYDDLTDEILSLDHE
jgi:chromosome partitioning protein